MAAAIAVVGLLTAETLRTTALNTKEVIRQPPAAETSAEVKADVEPTKFEATPSPVIEPDPKFFTALATEGSGSYDEPARR